VKSLPRRASARCSFRRRGPEPWPDEASLHQDATSIHKPNCQRATSPTRHATRKTRPQAASRRKHLPRGQGPNSIGSSPGGPTTTTHSVAAPGRLEAGPHPLQCRPFDSCGSPCCKALPCHGLRHACKALTPPGEPLNLSLVPPAVNAPNQATLQPEIHRAPRATQVASPES